MGMDVMLIVKFKMVGLVEVEAAQPRAHVQILSQHQADSLLVVT